MKHFTQVKDMTRSDFLAWLSLAKKLKTHPKQTILSGKTLAMIFEKPSNRTRLSFEVGMLQLGGHPIYIQKQDIGMGQRESVEDIARVMSKMVDGVMIRALSQRTIDTFAEFASVPVINGLSDKHHPCQALADILTIQESCQDISQCTVAYVGDGNNVCRSLIEACQLAGITIKVATPQGFEPEVAPDVLSHTVQDVVQDADVVYTDVWVSMGQEEDQQVRLEAFKAFGVDASVMALAKKDAIFMHCLPAIRGQEVTHEVIESHQSRVFEQAENRLHAQKAILATLLNKGEMV